MAVVAKFPGCVALLYYWQVVKKDIGRCFKEVMQLMKDAAVAQVGG